MIFLFVWGKSHNNKFWNKRLEAKYKEVEAANKIFTNTGKTEDYPLLKNRKNNGESDLVIRNGKIIKKNGREAMQWKWIGLFQ